MPSKVREREVGELCEWGVEIIPGSRPVRRGFQHVARQQPIIVKGADALFSRQVPARLS